MDLKHDWKALNDVLFPAEWLSPNGDCVVMLEDHEKVRDGVVSTGKVFDDFGAEGISVCKEKLDAMAQKYAVNKAIVISKRELEQSIVEVAALGTNYFQQLQTLRDKLLNPKNAIHHGKVGQHQGTWIVSQKHFILDLFEVKLRRLLPRQFNVLIFVDQRFSHTLIGSSNNDFYKSILLSYHRGKLNQFFEPDFSSLHENRLKEWTKESKAIGQYLESRYLLPCYGLFMYKDVWDRCLNAAFKEPHKPWRLFARGFDIGHACVYPYGYFAKALLAWQRIMMYFGRI